MASAGMTIKWIEEDMPVSPEMMAKRITNLRRIGLSELLKIRKIKNTSLRDHITGAGRGYGRKIGCESFVKCMKNDD